MITIKLSTDKKIELSLDEFNELSDKLRRMTSLREEVEQIQIGDNSRIPSDTPTEALRVTKVIC